MIPILTSDGVLAERVLIDDVFKAGETLYAGDCVAIAQDPDSPYPPRLYRIDANSADPYRSAYRVLGAVYATEEDSLGTTVKASDEDDVVVVVFGLARMLSDAAIGVGDPVVAANTPGRIVADITPAAGHMIGRAVTNTNGAGEEVEILISLG